MYLAEIHGKLSRENENKEDILTSNVFSFFKYADRRTFLYQFLKIPELNLPDITEDDAIQAEFHFWPSYVDGTQPDLVIIVGSYYLLFEAKYHSGFGEETSTKKHQLVREIEGGFLEAQNLDKKFKIISVTADYYRKPGLFQKIPACYLPDLVWINWQRITLLIFNILDQKPKIPKGNKLFADDLYTLLLKKNLRNFEGVKLLSNFQKLSSLQGELFFQASTANYRGNFIGFLSAMEDLQHISPFSSPLFFMPQKRFFTFPPSMDKPLIGQTEKLFFERK